jgi:hypothetical protein
MPSLVQAPHRRTLNRLGLRLRVARHRTQLDTALAEDADPAADPALALRARQLAQPSTLRAIASALDNILDAVEEPPEAWSSGGPRPPLQREAILAAQDELRTLAARLRETRSVSPQAAALAALLVWDSASPIYADRPGTTVEYWTAGILGALETL